MRFTLVVQPDGHAILATSEALDDDQTERLRASIADWRTRVASTLIVPECEVVQVVDVELDLA
jgi:hypothetical protein